ANSCRFKCASGYSWSWTTSSCQAYTYSWSTWSFWTCDCKTQTQTRTVICQRSDLATVADAFCTWAKPATSQSCTINNCYYTSATCNWWDITNYQATTCDWWDLSCWWSSCTTASWPFATAPTCTYIIWFNDWCGGNCTWTSWNQTCTALKAALNCYHP
ncbi:MAG: hypothetical protein ACD_4C00301G0002, partial [uncultured bacterium (gcode 4)]